MNMNIERNSKSYRLHKRFIPDVLRNMDPDKISEISSYYILLRSCSVFENIKDKEIKWVIDRILNTEINDIYGKLLKLGLTNQEIVFRLKRIKYIKNNEDEYKFEPTSILSDIGLMVKDSINIPYLEVKRIREEGVYKGERNPKKIKKMEQMEWILSNVKWKGRDGHINNGNLKPEEASKIININPATIRNMLKEYYKNKPVYPKFEKIEEI